MTSTPRIRAFLPGRLRLPAASHAGSAPQVFREFGRTLGRLERAAATRRSRDGEGA
ncbi:MAG: hypothetical protein K0S00_3782 [Xanthobacteraceae bacterium]|jgi:hypothetical protein|nr:hypothetical protein [Xanthobacteraceae bacterium]